MRMATTSIDFHFDYLSPYAYLGWLQLRPLCAVRELELVPQPLALGGLLKHWGQLGPAEIPPKALFTFKDCVRRAQRLGCAFRAPAFHPFNPLTALRVSLAEVAGSAQLRVVDALWQASWASGRDVGSPEVIREVLDEIGLDGATLVERAGAQDVKDQLKANTQRAIDLGVFGVPTILVEGELFWGADQIDWVALRLDGKDPLDRVSLAEIAPQGAGQHRKREARTTPQA
ncbi:MAG TPA: 2-hydroxychromene-2-carboxylate isomerase [Polyangiaceae bacterium]|nr:2-hydroxychromene-2-carboxylate isomerase [Polyangiaceae bacterium]